jgi:hypothetical protein
LPEAKVGAFAWILMDEAQANGLDRHQHEERLVISMSDY